LGIKTSTCRRFWRQQVLVITVKRSARKIMGLAPMLSAM